MKYFDIGKVVSYNRNFNFINGLRSIGKTYTTLKYIIRKCVEKQVEFVYIVRTKNEKKNNALEEGLEKVLVREFPEFDFEITAEEITLDGVSIGRCIALTEAYEIKKHSFPNVKYMVMDEYILENKTGGRYVNGWNEPDLLLSIYHTIDREEDRVVCFFLGNNISFYNPYHMHPAFNIPHIEPGNIWCNENVLFYWAVPSEELQEEKSHSKFLNMIQNTKYGTYAAKGEYVEDSIVFIEKMPAACRPLFTILCDEHKFTIWNDHDILYISDNVTDTAPFIFALTMPDHNESSYFTKSSKLNFHLDLLRKSYINAKVRFTSPEVKALSEPALKLLL